MYNRTYRGKLIEVVIKTITSKKHPVIMNKIKDSLSEKLNSNLKFKTTISNVKIEEGKACGTIAFNDENNSLRIVDFYINPEYFKLK